MSSRRGNTQLFALRNPPPEGLTLGGRRYRLERVFKHDFFAATALYAAAEPGDGFNQLVAKFGREQGFCGLPGAWVGAWLAGREERVHRRLDGIPGLQRWAGRLSRTAYALEYLEGCTLDTVESPPPGFFDRLRALIDAIHARRAAYGDLNKRSNILVSPDGTPGLIDFQITVLDSDLPGLAALGRALLGYLQRMDLYHLYKHKRRMVPGQLRAEEETLSRRRGGAIRWHRRLSTPLRRLRRVFLARRHREGLLVSPSAALETHEQPEKATWRDQ